MTAILERLQHRTIRPGFRYDIAGLRAIAVLMVTLCHFGIPGFSGGFIGPDIFFVLSGYLITGILYREFSATKTDPFKPGRISMSNFYLKRVRRIFPAAFFVLFAVNIYAYFNLNTLQVAQIKSDSIWTVFFAANINFMHQATDYFAQTLSASPLQHYWSLAVEEQFYLIWPMFFLFAANMQRMIFMKGDPDLWKRRLILFFGVICAVSAVWLGVEFAANPRGAFFSTFGRVWELALGGTLSLLDFQVIKTRLGDALIPLRWASLVAIFVSLLVVTPANFGYTLFLPAFATGFLLVTGAGQETPDLINRFLSIRVFTAIGAISYSLYLWHWPVVVFGTPLGYLDTLPKRLLGIVVTLLISTASYWLIEQAAMKIPLPKFERLKMRTAMRPHVQQSSLRTGSIALSLAGLLMFLLYPAANSQVTGLTPPPSAAQFGGEDPGTNQGPNTGIGQTTADQVAWQRMVGDSLKLKQLPANLKPSISELSGIAKTGGFGACAGKRQDAATLSSVCESLAVGNKKAHTAVVLGDSHARMLWPAIIGSLDPTKWNITLLAMPGCPVPVLTPNKLNSQNTRCAEHRELTLKYLERVKPDLTILNDNVDSTPTTGEYRVAYLKVMPRIAEASKYVVVIANTPKFPNLITCLDANDSLQNCAPKLYSISPLAKVQREIITRYQTGYWDISEALCAPNGRKILCPAVIGRQPTSADGAHLIPDVAAEIASFFAKALDKQGIQDLLTN
jgi:peptidoglycan/LPS O-acetylase OafA/YrhL